MEKQLPRATPALVFSFVLAAFALILGSGKGRACIRRSLRRGGLRAFFDGL